MELDLETAVQETKKKPEIDLSNLDINLLENIDWDAMICDSCQ